MSTHPHVELAQVFGMALHSNEAIMDGANWRKDVTGLVGDVSPPCRLLA